MREYTRPQIESVEFRDDAGNIKSATGRRRMHGGQVSGWITSVFTALSLIGMVAIHILPTGLSPVRDPVSQYHLTRYRPVVLLATLSMACAGIGAVFALSAVLGRVAAVCSFLLVLFAVSRALIPFLRMDPPGSPTTTVGRLHTVLAFGAFGSAIAVAFVAAGPLKDAGLGPEATWSTILGAVGAIGAAGLFIGRVSGKQRFFGLAERLIYAGFLAWFGMIGVTAVRGG